MNERLANDIRNNLQARLGTNDFSVTGKLCVGCEIEAKGWKRLKSMKAWYQKNSAYIGNDVFYVTAFRSYDTIVGFVYNRKLYVVGNYSSSTSRQITTFAAQEDVDEVVYYNRIRG